MFHSRKIGLALSGGGVRGLAHIGVIKALTEAGIRRDNRHQEFFDCPDMISQSRCHRW
ncbi:MAG TPA: patatin-like phospholipase family protein [Blastocatellia bacterium]|nr:patatin-like phospholipase family protein [Blastocatellia bacterium]